MTPAEHLGMARHFMARQQWDRAQAHYLAALVEAASAREGWSVPAVPERQVQP